jgi:hypothetical protein
MKGSDFGFWHKREVVQCRLYRRFWSMSGRNADIGKSAGLTRNRLPNGG